MDFHRKMVKKGQYKEAKILYDLLRKGKVSLGLDDSSWVVQEICESLGCRINYKRCGYSAVAYL